MNPFRSTVHLYISLVFFGALAIMAIAFILRSSEMNDPVVAKMRATVPAEAY